MCYKYDPPVNIPQHKFIIVLINVSLQSQTTVYDSSQWSRKG